MRRHDYSQHFLRNPNLVKELIGHSNIKKNDVVIDIGAGSGVITSVLARRTKHVIAIENETRVLDILRDNLSAIPNVSILEQDILAYRPPTGPYKIFANIPFHLSADIVRKFTSESNPPRAMYLIAQKQFARKLLIDQRGNFTGLIGAQIAPWFDVRIRRPLRRTDYTPPPNVDTVLLEIRPKAEMLLALKDQSRFWHFCEKSFHSQPYFASLPLTAILTTNKRPSELATQEWTELFKLIQMKSDDTHHA